MSFSVDFWKLSFVPYIKCETEYVSKNWHLSWSYHLSLRIASYSMYYSTGLPYVSHACIMAELHVYLAYVITGINKAR